MHYPLRGDNYQKSKTSSWLYAWQLRDSKSFADMLVLVPWTMDPSITASLTTFTAQSEEGFGRFMNMFGCSNPCPSLNIMIPLQASSAKQFLIVKGLKRHTDVS